MFDFMQVTDKTQGVILTQKHLSFSGNFVQSSKKLFYGPKNEISDISILHFPDSLHIISPIYFVN